jgi:hypothetical protein
MRSIGGQALPSGNPSAAILRMIPHGLVNGLAFFLLRRLVMRILFERVS